MLSRFIFSTINLALANWKIKKKNNPRFEEFIVCHSTCINEAEQLAQSSYDITTCNSKRNTSISDFSKGKRVQSYLFGVQSFDRRGLSDIISMCQLAHRLWIYCPLKLSVYKSQPMFANLHSKSQLCCHDPSNIAQGPVSPLFKNYIAMYFAGEINKHL